MFRARDNADQQSYHGKKVPSRKFLKEEKIGFVDVLVEREVNDVSKEFDLNDWKNGPAVC